MNLTVLFKVCTTVFLLYLLLYALCQLISAATGTYSLLRQDRMRRIHNQIKHDYYFPVSILVPACNQADQILPCIESLLALNYRLYEIIVVDDGSKDNTAQALIDRFHLRRVDRPIRRSLSCKPHQAIYESDNGPVSLTLIQKENGGKSDALNMGINAAHFPFFLCVDADSMLQKDALERIVLPVMEDDGVVAVGGLTQTAQCIRLNNGTVEQYSLPRSFLLSLQVLEHERTLLASRILPDRFNSTLCIPGSFCLYRKDVVIAAGGYDENAPGADAELIVRLHAFCRASRIPCSVRRQPTAVCWTQAPSTLRELVKQQRRRHQGLFYSLMKHRGTCLSHRFTAAGSWAYLYHLLYRLFSPHIQLLGLFAVILPAVLTGAVSISLLLGFSLLCGLCAAILTVTAFFQHVYTQNLPIRAGDVLKACLISPIEAIFFRVFLGLVQILPFSGR